MASPTWSPGDVLGARYRLIARLGAGGMGEVWSAEHLALGTTVAVKLLHPDIAGRPGTGERFEREARAAASLTSPHVVQIFDHGSEREVPYIVMERLVGETLAQRLKREGALPPDTVVRVVSHLGRALTKAHEAAIIHRDIKPENVFLVAGEDGEVAKLLDFGIAKVTAEIAGQGASTRTRSGALLGTPLYMSPEQLRERPLDFRTDLWSLALLSFECLTGTTAFSGNTVAEITSDILSGHLPVPSERAPVPAGFDAWFRRAASREPLERFGSAREMAEALASLCREDAGSLSTPATPSPASSIGSAIAGPAERLESPSISAATGSAWEKRASRPARRWLGVALALAAVLAMAIVLASRAPVDEHAAAVSPPVDPPSNVERAPATSPSAAAVSAPTAPATSEPAPEIATAATSLKPEPRRLPASTPGGPRAPASTAAPASTRPAASVNELAF